jgi:MFS family permease
VSRTPANTQRAEDRPSSGGRGGGQPISKWAILALVAAGTFMTTVDGSIVNISLPAIARSFGVPVGGTIEWVIIGYLLVIASVLLTFGRLSDMIGRKPIFATGLAVFTLGSGLCGVAPSLRLLIAARALQGIGAANLAIALGPYSGSIGAKRPTLIALSRELRLLGWVGPGDG